MAASQLVVLDCSWNCLTRLPVWLEQLTHCSRLELSGNPVELPQLPAQLGQNCRWLKYLAIQSIALRLEKTTHFQYFYLELIYKTKKFL